MSPTPSTPRPPTDSELAATIRRNTLYGMLATAVLIGSRLVVIPVVIGRLGLDGYGIWSIIATTAAYMRFGSVGVKHAFQKYVAESTGTGDVERVNVLLSTGSAAMLTLSLAGLVPMAALSRQMAAAMGVPPRFFEATAQSLLLLAIIMILSNAGGAYEAIVAGANRLDLTRKLRSVLTVLEAGLTIVLLRRGFGLVAMAIVMAASETTYVLCCVVLSRRVLPSVRLRPRFVTRRVLTDLAAFAGSYQLVNLMEVLYTAIIPIALLRFFGAEVAGVYALASRLVTVALMGHDAFLLPTLSGASMVFASGTPEAGRVLMLKSFKTTVALAMIPLAFIAVNGSAIVFVWTGWSGASLDLTIWLICAAAFFKSISLLALVLYRAAGRSWMDNIRQVLRIAVLLSIVILGRQVGFHGILLGLAVSELTGLAFMLFALVKAFPQFQPRLLLPDVSRLALATAAMTLGGVAAAHAPLSGLVPGPRLVAALALALSAIVSFVVLCPALIATRAVSRAEAAEVLKTFSARRVRRASPLGGSATCQS